ncbi:MAG: hypothetical protein KAQ64_01475 [Candidatus Pacebacteria bacterium]|nr:hypothetical protein [Candidatus Paceibacterota bacterium]
MQEILNFPIKKKICILSLGAESVGRFCFYDNGKIYISENFGDILDVKNLANFNKAILKQIETKKPNIILTDFHPFYNSTVFGSELSKKLKIPHIQVQHHIAHIFSTVGDNIIRIKNQESRIKNLSLVIPKEFYGIASDGTGFGFDRNIWGGEVFQVKNEKRKTKSTSLVINRISSLEEQTMIGGDLAVKEPARMLISILSKFLPKEKVYENVKKFYTENEFELLYNQLQQNFNCQKTTSTGRILDAVSVLLGFADNKRDFKHEATKLLEENSTLPYKDYELRIKNYKSRKIINTTYLFEYLLKNIHKDKKRLAATAQECIARGFYEIIRRCAKETRFPIGNRVSDIPDSRFQIPDSFLAGGMANNKIISSYLENKDVYTSKKIPRGDEGIAFGQIVFYILN